MPEPIEAAKVKDMLERWSFSLFHYYEAAKLGNHQARMS